MTRTNFNRLLMGALAVVIGSGAVAISLNESVSAQTDEVKAVTDVMTREALAVEQGDLAALDKIWANSEDVTVFESGHANYGWNDYRNTHLAPELKEFKNTKYSFSDMKVKVDGKTAWATFKYSLAAEMGTRKVESGGLGTAVLEKRDGKWRIVHWHSSAPRRAPAPAASPTPKA
ncbi:MAG: nuclear transport factor 2 family protein [Chloracidobacterium sp.]|nr:nuclear transport factor 2 family protein [Chloracidobacterium sp.]MBX3283621.1 nuclear transport factor 2 family protein [Acidobacteriota bacterium]MCC7307419.1 nuclear transport factor 2 family protein [Acidobacteriota bacterium]HMM78821.1 nuclear transport factor 2 family protein [Pyrinomonadaceae bacterium]